MTLRAEVLVSGRVQGVGYRAFVRGLAREAGLTAGSFCWSLPSTARMPRDG